jgi:hypothetical protein
VYTSAVLLSDVPEHITDSLFCISCAECHFKLVVLCFVQTLFGDIHNMGVLALVVSIITTNFID